MQLGKKLLLIILLLTSLLIAKEELKFPIQGMEIKEFLGLVARVTGTNILIDGNLRGKIDFVQTEDVKKDDLFPIALSILDSKNYTLVKISDKVWKVVRKTDAPGKGLQVNRDNPSGNLMQTTIFKVKSVDVASVNAKIRPLLSRNAKSTFFKGSNLFVVTDYPQTIKAVKKILNVVDSAKENIIKVVELKNAKAKDIYPQIDRISKTYFNQRIDTERVTVVRSDISNSIILIGQPENVNKLYDVIMELDKSDDVATPKIYVYELKNSGVEQMQKLLTELLTNDVFPSSSSTSISSKSKSKKAPVIRRTKRFNPDLKTLIAADLERNALVIMDTPERYREIEKTIKLLDVEKPQVYVQARIVEVSNNKTKQVGMKYGLDAARAAGNGLYTLGTSLTGTSIALPSTLVSSIDTSVIKEGFAIGFSLSLLEQNGAANVLSEPTILCSNNKESSIYVGKTQSILTSSTQGDNANDVVRNKYSREDIGLTLKVKPRLTSKNKVILDIFTKIEDIDKGSTTLDRPTTLKREVKTTATVRNGETIILGGLMKDSEGESISKIPGLGDIPIIGNLFTYKGTSKDQISIVIYITPYIVPTSSDLRDVRKLLSELDRLQRRYNRRVTNRLLNRVNYQGNNGSKSGDKS